jgi:hypothetical protein
MHRLENQAMGVPESVNKNKWLKTSNTTHNAGVGGSSPPVATIQIQRLM